MDGIAVIGAGLAGLAAAAALAAAGRRVAVIEKSRGLGGRLATRRRSGMPVFDHGAPSVIGTGGFADALADWEDLGAAAPWGDGHVGLPGMSGLVKPLAEGLDLRTETEIHQLSAAAPGAGPGWRLVDGAGGVVEAETLLLAIPSVQASRLLAGVAEVPGLAEVAMTPMLTLMAGFPEPLGLPDRIEGDGAPLATAVRNGAKPGRDPTQEAWVVHAGADWSRAHLEDLDGARTALLRALGELAGAALPPADPVMIHRWRYAFAERPLGRACHWDPTARLGLCGDWCHRAELSGGLSRGAEAAFESGRALAEAVLAA